MLISVVIVNYRVPFFLHQTIRSLHHAELFDQTEVIVVDNASQDNSEELIKRDFPETTWISLRENIGFGKACNVGAHQARGKFILFLNPDTMVSDNTLAECVHFFERHPECGLMGPRVLNPDGTLQVSCRRSFPTPAVALYRFTGLSRLFPKSKVFGKYNVTYLDENQESRVDAVSGSFMVLPLSLFRRIGGFDERFFMYGEDLDLCAKVAQEGKEVWYNPSTQIVHFKGRSARRRSFKTRLSFYQAMVLFSRKYRHTHGAFLPSWLVLLGILIQGGAGMVANMFNTLTATLIDLGIVNIVLWAGLLIRFQFSPLDDPYASKDWVTVSGLHALVSACFLWVLAYRGIYSRERYSIRNMLASGFAASLIFMTCVYFIRSVAFSRLALGASSVVTTFLLIGWRHVLPSTAKRLRRKIFSTGNVVVLGNGEVTESLIQNIESDSSARLRGVVWPVDDHVPGHFKGYPVLGSINNIDEILKRERADILLISTAEPWYSHIIKALSSARRKSLTIRWVPHEVLDQKRSQLPEEIPLQDFKI